MPGQIQGSRAGPGPAWGWLGGGGGLAVPIQEAVGQRPQQIRRLPEPVQTRGRSLGELGRLRPCALDPEN